MTDPIHRRQTLHPKPGNTSSSSASIATRSSAVVFLPVLVIMAFVPFFAMNMELRVVQQFQQNNGHDAQVNDNNINNGEAGGPMHVTRRWPTNQRQTQRHYLCPRQSSQNLDGINNNAGNGRLNTTDSIEPRRAASCPRILDDPNIYDPNKGIDKNETRRLTITEPQFYISLHSQNL